MDHIPDFVRIKDKDGFEGLVNIHQIVKITTSRTEDETPRDPAAKGVMIAMVGSSASTRFFFEDVTRSLNEWQGIVAPE